MTEFNNRRLEIDALRALLAVRHHGGVTRAAEALGLSQSAVSHKIKRLETNLGCDLPSRTVGAAMFTAAGADLLDYAGRIISLHDEALLSLTKTPLAGRIALGLTEIPPAPIFRVFWDAFTACIRMSPCAQRFA